MSNLFIKKNLEKIHTPKHGFKQTLGSFHLTMIGIGAIIGAGIFSLVGTTAAYYSGPGIIFSFLIAGLISVFAGLCYAEMAAMYPISGSAYTYAYAALGEVIAWIIGWDLILEYTFGGVAISISWSGYFLSLLTKTLGLSINDSLLQFTKGPLEILTLSTGEQVHGIWNIPATLITLLLSVIIYRGIQESARVNTLMVFIKVSIILAFIALGWTVLDPALWIANPSATGLGKLVPPAGNILKNGQEVMSLGWSGVITGAGVVFFAYIGFDMISTMAQECKNPAKNLPIGILASLVICTVLYIAVSLVMTGIVPYHNLGVSDPIAVGIDKIVLLRNWSPEMRYMITLLVKIGALAGLTSGLLVVLVGQSRIFYAMSKDGLLPWFKRVHSKYATPHIATLATVGIVALLSGILPIAMVGELVSIGTLLAFFIVFVGVIILRIQQPHIQRPFKTPFYKFIAPAGAIICLWVMLSLPRETWIRLIVWLLAGLFIYFVYGVKNSIAREDSKNAVTLS